MSLPMRKIENTTTYVKPVAKIVPVIVNPLKNAVETHIENLRSYQHVEEDAGLQKLYQLEVKEKPGLIKSGDTERSVELRNQETMTNASLHRKEGTFAVWVVSEKWDGSVFRDKEFNAVLKEKGYEFEPNDQGNDSEWVKITRKEYYRELKEFMGKPVRLKCQLRPAQLYLRELVNDAIDEGYEYINAGFCVRVGKTLISLTNSADQDWMPLYLGKNLTSQSSATADNTLFGVVPEMLTQSIHGDNEQDLKDDEVSEKVKTIIANIEEANVNNRKIFVFIDEVDDQSHTENSRAVITPVVEYLKQIGMFGAIETMSGTRIHRGMKVLNDLTSDPIKELSLEYYEMQILQPERTCKRNYRHLSFYSDDASGLTNISDAMKNHVDGHKSLSTAMKYLLGTNHLELYENDNCPHWFIKIVTQYKSNITAFTKHLNRNHSIIEKKKYRFEPLNGDFTCNAEAEVYCKRIIDKYPDKIVVFITQGMATTSFSVATIGNSALFTDGEISANDIQGLHRSATWAEGKDECNMTVITTNDSKEHRFDDIFEYEIKIARSREEKQTIMRELLTCNSMIHINKGQTIRKHIMTIDNVDLVIDKKAKSMSTTASIMRLVMDDFDEDILNDIKNSKKIIKSTNKKSNTDKGDKYDPYGNDLDEDDNNKKSKSSSPKDIERKIRAFVEAARNVPAIAREQETTMKEFEYWEEIGITKEFFFKAYNSSPLFRDRIDSIFNLCEDDTYLIETFLDKLI